MICLEEESCCVGAPPDPGSKAPLVWIERKLLRRLTSPGPSIETTDRAGLLIGETLEGGTLRLIGSVELFSGQFPDNSLSALENAVASLLGEAARLWPGKSVLGWFHTHPGFGVFVSSEDMVVHQNLSAYGCQIALIIDPIKNQASFFFMDGDCMKACPGYCVFDLPTPTESSGDPESCTYNEDIDLLCGASTAPGIPPQRGTHSFDHATPDPCRQDEEISGRDYERPPVDPYSAQKHAQYCTNFGRWTQWFIPVALCVVLVLATSIVFTSRRSLSLVSSATFTLQHLGEKLDIVEMRVAQVEATCSGAACEPIDESEEGAGIGGSTFDYVTILVLPGDTVYDIARRFYGSVHPHIIDMVAKTNDISDARHLRAGTTIKVPLMPRDAGSEHQRDVEPAHGQLRDTEGRQQ